MSKEPTHILFPSTGLWSHVIANIQTGVRIVQASPNTYLTYLGTGSDPDMTKVSNMFKKDTTDVLSRIQVLEVAPGVGTDPGPEWKEPSEMVEPVISLDGFEWAWLDLLGDNLGSGLGNKWKIKPTLWLYDANALDCRHVANALHKSHGLPRLPGFLSSGIASTTLLRIYSEEKVFSGISGAAGLRARFDKAIESGLPPMKAMSKVRSPFHAFEPVSTPTHKLGHLELKIEALFNDQGRLLKFEDMPPMYDYEFRPQSSSTLYPPGVLALMEKFADSESVIDGLLDYGVPEFEPYATSEFSKLLASNGKKHFPIGYGLTRAEFEAQNPVTRAKNGSWNAEEKEVMEFLDQMKAQHGSHSAAYICFGSIVWPTERPEIIEQIVDGLLEANPPIPFLCAVSSIQKPVPVPDSVKDKAAKSGMGKFVDWAPQMSVLQHEAVRFFISHCGAGSMIESVYAGIPIVAVPFVNDEAFIARQLVAHKAAIQLHQLNSGMKGRPLGIGGTVTEDPKDIRGEMEEVYGTLRDPAKYEEYRGNVRKLSSLLETSAKSGESAKALQRFVDEYL